MTMPARTTFAITTLMIGLAIALPARSEQSDDPAKLANALTTVPMPLQDGFRVSESKGRPISGKYEIEDGALQLSIYTVDGSQFYEVIVDFVTGLVAKSDPLSKSDDITAAHAQIAAMADARTPLATVADKVEKVNAGYRAVSVTPTVKDGHSVAAVTLLRGTTLKTVDQPID